MVSFKSNKSNLNRKNPIFFSLKKNHDLYQLYSLKMVMKEALHMGHGLSFHPKCSILH